MVGLRQIKKDKELYDLCASNDVSGRSSQSEDRSGRWVFNLKSPHTLPPGISGPSQI
jgi:hypothetical protein